MTLFTHQCPPLEIEHTHLYLNGDSTLKCNVAMTLFTHQCPPLEIENTHQCSVHHCRVNRDITLRLCTFLIISTVDSNCNDRHVKDPSSVFSVTNFFDMWMSLEDQPPSSSSSSLPSALPPPPPPPLSSSWWRRSASSLQPSVCSGVCKQSPPQCLVYPSLQICSLGQLVFFLYVAFLAPAHLQSKGLWVGHIFRF